MIRIISSTLVWRNFSILLFTLLMPLILSGILLDTLGFKYLESIGEILSMTLLLGFVHFRLHPYTSYTARL